MKKIIAVVGLACSFLTSCSVISGNANKGVYFAGAVGTNFKGIAQTPQGYTAEEIDNATSFREGTSTIKTGLYMAALESAVSSISKSYSSVQKYKNSADVKKFKASEATKQAKINAETEQLEILNPVEEVPAE